MNFKVITMSIIRLIELYAVLTEGTSNIFPDQTSTPHTFRKVHIMLASKFSTIYNLVSKI
jgi:hypothetical protein